MKIPQEKLVLLRKNLPFIVAAVSALLAVVLINFYIKRQAEEARRRALEMEKNFINVIVANQDIPAGQAIQEEMLAEQRIMRDRVQPEAATSYGKVLGKIALAPISQGEQVLLNKVSLPRRREAWLPLSAKIPPGKRAITITVDNISSVGSMVRPGDYVDLIAIVSSRGGTTQEQRESPLTTYPLFQHVLVLAVDQETDVYPTPGTKEQAGTVTLALSPQEANIISFMEEKGRIRLFLRSPKDEKATRMFPTDWDAALNVILPDDYRGPSKKKVEIYHGLRREIRDID